jgi:hypothetical protein
MVSTDLRQDLIDTGAALVQRLDDAGAQPDAALWLYEPEVKTWKLVLAEAKAAKQGPKEAYRQIQKILATMPEEQRKVLALEDIAIANPDSPVISLLRLAVKTGPGISGIRFRNNVINGTLIDDAYIYRLT